MNNLIPEFYELADGTKVPKIGFGCFNPKNQEFSSIIKAAFKAGYRYFDTASLYETERNLEEALNETGAERGSVQIASKAWYDELGYEEIRSAAERSLNRLKTDYLDFYFIHWPKQSEDDRNWKDRDARSWEAMIEMKKEGKIRHICTSNFLPHHIENLISKTGVKPEINQLEAHIGYSQELALSYCKKKDILVQAWSPLQRGRGCFNEIISETAKKYKKTEAQISIRFLIQKDVMPIPKAGTTEHMLNNADVFGFEISTEDMWKLSCMPQITWLGEHPDFNIPKKKSNTLQ